MPALKSRPVRYLPVIAAFVLPVILGGAVRLALAGGGGENVLLIINPMNRESLLIGNYYAAARGIPERNVLYLVPASANYPQFVTENTAATFGSLANRELGDHIDFVVVTPGNEFFINAPGLVNDSCSPVTKFSTGSAFTMSFIANSIRQGGQQSTRPNRYFGTSNTPLAFDSNTRWFGGIPSDRPDAEQYFVGVMLGYTGERGNTVAQVLDMIDRSVAVDGTFPGGTFYFMQTNDDLRSSPRHGWYPIVRDAIRALGGQAEHLCCNALPNGAQDVLGLMTGAATVDIEGSGINILPGAFCDHLTSFAGTFDNGSQTKMSRWIANGASGTAGTVEEPCNYPGKFPHARMHLYYFQGLTLGESVLRSLAQIPFQVLVMGDPLTQPFTHIPQVSVVDAPTGPVSGIIRLTPDAQTSHPTALISHYDLLIDGATTLTVQRGRVFSLDTTRLSDGWHDLRVLAYDDSDVRSTGRWRGALVVNNLGRSATIQSSRQGGNYADRFDFTMSATGGGVVEYRVIQNGRVLGAVTDPANPVRTFGATLGAGDIIVQGEALFADGSLVRSEPLALTVADDPGSPAAIQPYAYSFTKHVLTDQPVLLELPGTFNQFDAGVGYEIRTPPSHSTIISTTTGPYRVLQPDPNATGTDQLTFQWTSPNGNSNIGTITLVYRRCIPGRLQLAVGPLRRGQQGVFDVSCAYPNEMTYLAYSLQGTGNVFVPQLNVTLNLRNPVQAGNPKRSDAEGNVRWTLPVPNISPRPVWIQAAQRSAVSNVVETMVN